MVLSVSARACQCRNPAFQSEITPRKAKKGPFSPFLLQGCRLNTGMVFLKGIQGLEIVSDMVTSATNISSLVTKNSGLVAFTATTFLC